MKVVMLGPHAWGKTACIRRFIDSRYQDLLTLITQYAMDQYAVWWFILGSLSQAVA